MYRILYITLNARFNMFKTFRVFFVYFMGGVTALPWFDLRKNVFILLQIRIYLFTVEALVINSMLEVPNFHFRFIFFNICTEYDFYKILYFKRTFQRTSTEYIIMDNRNKKYLHAIWNTWIIETINTKMSIIIYLLSLKDKKLMVDN